MGGRLAARSGHQFLRRCRARLRFHYAGQTRKDDFVCHTSRAGEMVCRDVENFARRDRLSAGDEFVAKFTADYYQRFMQAWEKELNHFLKTGSRLKDDAAA